MNKILLYDIVCSLKIIEMGFRKLKIKFFSSKYFSDHLFHENGPTTINY